jgi:hypothetical protein
MLSFKLELPGLFKNNVLDVFSQVSVVRMIFWIPFKELVEYEALTEFNGVLTIKSTLNLHRESRGLVVSIENLQRWKWG